MKDSLEIALVSLQQASIAEHLRRIRELSEANFALAFHRLVGRFPYQQSELEFFIALVHRAGYGGGLEDLASHDAEEIAARFRDPSLLPGFLA